MFDALDEFVTKMKEADRRFTVFPHNLSHYGTLDNLPHSIKDPEDLPTEVDDWLVYFPQAKPQYNGGMSIQRPSSVSAYPWVVS